MITAVIVVVFIAAIALVIIVVSAARRPLSAIAVARQLASAPNADFAAMKRAGDLAQTVRAARERQAAVLETVIRPTLLGQSRPDEAERLVRGLRVAAEEYAGQMRMVLATAAEEATGRNTSTADDAALARRLDALPALFSRRDEQLDGGEFAAALTALSAAGLPAAPAWEPSRQYQATWDRVADQLRDAADQQPRTRRHSKTTAP